MTEQIYNNGLQWLMKRKNRRAIERRQFTMSPVTIIKVDISPSLFHRGIEIEANADLGYVNENQHGIKLSIS